MKFLVMHLPCTKPDWSEPMREGIMGCKRFIRTLEILFTVEFYKAIALKS
jgi:hypothetical protein